jgi:phosphatidylserine/phosphatidylglycerophosphate/cardiolipin synthase-like enzyme
MKTPKSFLLFVICYLLFAICVFPQDFTLVESTPVETILDESKLPRAADVWYDMISSANKTLDIEMFYIANEKGEVLEKILKAVKDAAGRGVQVRVIIDESFYNSSEKSADELNDIKNITIRKIPFKKIAGGVMHAKYFVVDGKDLFLGSQNMDWRALKHIHEMGMRVKSEKMAKAFLNIFEIDWNLCVDYSDTNIKLLKKKYAKDIINSKSPLKINDANLGLVKLYPAFSPAEVTPTKCNKEINELVKIIKNSKQRLCIQMYSYSLKGESKSEEFDKIDKALRDAAGRGVKIKIIFSNWTIKKGATESIQDLSTVPNIEIKFSSIPEYSGGFIPYARVEHCKYFISDDNISWISTANWERSYFYDCRNATMIIQNKKVNSQLEEVFLRDWNGPLVESVEVNKEYKTVKKNK